MKLITCASFYGSGSSAVADLIAEYENVKELSNYEFRFLHQLDGVADLEYHLIENHHRMNSGHALKRFERLMSFYEGNRFSKQYAHFFEGDSFHRLTKEYIQSLLDFNYPGWQFYDLYDKGIFLYYLYQIFNHAYRRLDNSYFRVLKHEKIYCSHPSEDYFLQCTKDYTHNLFVAMNNDNSDYLLVEQLVPTSNIARYNRYLKDDLFVLIVDRDPRDVYILEKYYWKDGMCPTNVDQFCDWFKYARESGHGIQIDNETIIRIQFEDLIYKYDESVKTIERFTGLTPDNHKYVFEKMNPLCSINNTQLWKKHPDSNIKIIEERLGRYLYPFESVDYAKVKGKETVSNTPF